MSSRWTVRGVPLSAKQAEVLCTLVKGPSILAELNGWGRNCLTALEAHDLVDLDDKRATITDEGRKVVIELNAKVNGTHKDPTTRVASSTSKGSTSGASKPSTRKTARQSRPSNGETASAPPSGTPAPPQAHLLDLDKLRLQIDERYRSDCDAIERMRELAAEVG